MSDYGAIKQRLEEGREKLGGFGEPVWSQALMALRSLTEENERLKELLRRVDAAALVVKADYEAKEAQLSTQAEELERLREALRDILNELGLPDRSYPAPVANAVAIAQAALQPPTQQGEPKP